MGLFFRQQHLVNSLVPPKPGPKVKFDIGDGGEDPVASPKGVDLLSDRVLSSLIDSAKRGGFDDQFGLVAYLTKVYGGDLVQNAIMVNELERMERGLDGISRRVNNIDVVQMSEEPRTTP